MPPRIAAIDFRLDVNSNFDALNVDPKFRSEMAALLFDEERWAELGGRNKHFSTSFRRRNRVVRRQFCARMSAYLTPPERRTLEARLEAEARNRPAYLRSLKEKR